MRAFLPRRGASGCWPCPVGTSDNSPGLQSWEQARPPTDPVPLGTAERGARDSVVPNGTGISCDRLPSQDRGPGLVSPCPYGTGTMRPASTDGPNAIWDGSISPRLPGAHDDPDGVANPRQTHARERTRGPLAPEGPRTVARGGVRPWQTQPLVGDPSQDGPRRGEGKTRRRHVPGNRRPMCPSMSGPVRRVCPRCLRAAGKDGAGRQTLLRPSGAGFLAGSVTRGSVRRNGGRHPWLQSVGPTGLNAARHICHASRRLRT